jgi:hypothetical protein
MNNNPLADFKVNTKLLDRPLYYRKSVDIICDKQKELDDDGHQTKFYELRNKIKLITGDDIIIDKDKFEPHLISVRMDNRGKPIRYYKDQVKTEYILSNICICSCCLCSKLYIVHNLTKDIYLAVGSVCIERFIKGFAKRVEYHGRNGECKYCKKELIINGDNKNSTRELKKRGICKKCCVKEIIQLKISYGEKDIYKKYGTKWNADNKFWYWEGDRDNIPDELKNKIAN